MFGLAGTLTAQITPGTATYGTFNNSSSATISYNNTSGANKILMVGVAAQQPNASVTSITFNGSALTKLGNISNPSQSRIEIWYLKSPPVGTFNVLVNNSNSDNGVIGVMAFSGVNQTTPFGTLATAQGSGTSASVAASSASGELVYGVACFNNWDADLTPGSGQTEYWDQTVNSSATGAGGTKAGAASVTMSWTSTSASYTIGAVSLKPAATVSPGGVTGAAIWLKANQGVTTGATMTWADQSGNNRNGVQATAANQPVLATSSINFNPALSFDGTNDFLSLQNLTGLPTGAAQVEVFATANNLNLSSPWSNIVSYGTGSLSQMFGLAKQASTINAATVTWGNDAVSANGEFAGNRPTLLDGKYTGTQVVISSLGVQRATQTSTNNKTTAAGSIGAYPVPSSGAYWNGHIPEIILFPTNLSAANALRVNSYLALKYGITLDQTSAQNYVGSDGTTIFWNGTTNSAHKNNISGIVRDDVSGLNQKQSKSVNTGLQVAMGNGNTIASNNTSNSNNFSADKSALVWGDNASSVAAWSATGAPVSRQILARTWKVQETGTVGSVKVQIADNGSANGLPAEVTAVYLLVDADGNFAAGATEIAMTLNGTNWEANADFANGQFFTFATNTSGTVLNNVTFTQGTPMCTNLEMPAGGVLQVKTFVAGTGIPANPNITAKLKHGSTTFATMTNPVYNGGAGTLTWSQVLGSSYTLPAGEQVSLDITKNDAGYSIDILYDSQTKPSKIDLPTKTIIVVEELAVYDSTYANGSVLAGTENGKTVFVLTTVSDPFGPEDVTSLDLTIKAPSGLVLVDTTLNDASVVATVGCNKIYEFAWLTGVEQGTYHIDVVAHEGYEGITDEASTTIEIQYDDYGTPCAVQFNSGSTGGSTTNYDPNQQVCVQVVDMDENENPAVAETVSVIITSAAGDDELRTLTETGVNTGIFKGCINASSSVIGTDNNGTLYAPMGGLLTLRYTDVDLSADECNASAIVNSTVPDIDIAIQLMDPTDGVAVVGEPIRFDITVSNPGTTTLTSITLTNTFNTGQLTYVGASLPPNTLAGGSLTWTINVPIPTGASFTIETYFTGAAPANTAVSTASVSGVDINSIAVSAGPVNDDVLITNPMVSINKYKSAPATGPHLVGSTLTFKIDVTNTGNTNITTLPLSDVFSPVCLQFVSASPAPSGTGAGSLLWNNIGPLNVGASTTITTSFKVVGDCSPVVNQALISNAVDINGDGLPNVSDTANVVVIAPPIAVDDVDTTGIATPITVSVLANDSDPNNNILTNSLTTSGTQQPSNGSITVNTTNGTITYTPQAGFTGIDSFEYIICDATSLCDTAMVTIYVFNEDCSNGIDDDGDGLIDCNDPDCSNFTNGGSIIGNESLCGAYDPTEITSFSLPSGGIGGGIEYRWELSTNGGATWTLIPGANGASYDPPLITQSTYFRRSARRFACGNWIIAIEVLKATTNCPEICDNGMDDDGDGLTDCLDSDCQVSAFAGTDVTICNNTSTVLTASATGGTPPYTFIWDNNLGEGESHTVSPLVTTTYRVMALSAIGCIGVDSLVVTVIPCTEICADGLDNDSDGLVDCADPDCAAVGQPNLADDTYPTCPGLVFQEQPIFNDVNIQYPVYSIFTPATKGAVTINALGVFTYTPYNSACGVDSFKYQVCNALTGCCDKATVKLQVGDNLPPTLQNLPADVTIACGDPIPVAPTVIGLDACPGIYVTFDETTNQGSSGSCQNYQIVRTWSAYDKCGNYAVGKQTITVADVVEPEIFRGYTLSNGKKLLAGIHEKVRTSWTRVKFLLLSMHRHWCLPKQ
ncbi:MAG: cadherin-like domain-containing protein [Saprospiraceae bacterium]|nr:cadherin-like domain-containing protein [Saprospiraceae bacterium]